MAWINALLVLLPIVTGQIIFPGEQESLLASRAPPRSTTVPSISSSLDPTVSSSLDLSVTSSVPSTSVFESSPVSSFSVISTTSLVPSISLSLDSVTRTIPGSVSKPSSASVLRPTPVPAEPEFTSTSSVQLSKRPTSETLHPEVPKTAPITPTPVNVLQTAPSTFPDQILSQGFEHEPSVGTTISSRLLTSASAVASTPVVTTSRLTPGSLVPVRTASVTPPSTASVESVSSFSTPDEFSNEVGSSHQREPSGESAHREESSHHEESPDSGDSVHVEDSLQHGDSSNPGDPSQQGKPSGESSHREESSHHGDSSDFEDSSHQRDSVTEAIPTTDNAVTTDPQEATTPDPEILDQMLTNAVITMGDFEDADVGSSISPCLTPLGETGTCILFKDCAGYSPLVNHMENKIVVSYLRARACRLLPRAILFCCPESKPVLPLGF